MKRDVYDPKQFEYRVQYAASQITRCDGVPQGRSFDTCFEMGDGDEVVEALVRRVERNPGTKLARNLFKAISRELAEANRASFKNTPRRELGKSARASVHGMLGV